MSVSIESTITVSFHDVSEAASSNVTISYRFEHNAVELKQGDHIVRVPFEDSAEFVAIFRKWVEENT